MSTLEQNEKPDTSDVQPLSAEEQRVNSLYEHAEQIERCVAELHAAFVHIEGELPSTHDAARDIAIVRKQIESIHTECAWMRYPGLRARAEETERLVRERNGGAS